MPHAIVTDELALLERVQKLLAEEPYVLPPKEDEIVAELVRLRDEIPTAKVEDQGALMDQYHQLVSVIEQLRESRRAPQVDPACPYFAHLRLTEGEKTRDVFLGKATRIQHGIRIIDWRNAPISRLFYRYQQGDDYEEELGGKQVVGEVVARRSVTIHNGELVRVEAPEGVFRHTGDEWTHTEREAVRLAGGEGVALRAHAAGEGTGRRLGTDLEGSRKRLDKRLPDVAGLLDPAQFAVITKPSTGLVVVRGSAGSGKTTVALHRIAWLAYDDPAIDSERTMFVVFSPALRDYVSHVLPALGVHRARITTFHEWAEEQRRRQFPMLPRKVRGDTPAVVTRLKLHPAILVALEEQVKRVNAPRTAESAIDDWASVLTHLEVLTPILDELAPGAFSAADLDKATTWCRRQNTELVKWLDGEREDVLAELDEEDDALLLRAWQLRVGPLRAKSGATMKLRHLAIDEVQDLSPLEVRVLLSCLDERQSVTLAGDTQQHVMNDSGFTSWDAFFGHLGMQGTTVDTLKISYRCTAEVMSFAVELLGELREDDGPPAVTRSGPAVELFQFTDHGACVAFLGDVLDQLMHDEPLASVAVLTPGSDVSRMYFSGLQKADIPRLRLVESQDFTFAPGIEITEIDQVKGLEFDYVVLIDVTAARFPVLPAARRLLHVGATRAVHQLWLTSVGTPSAIVREALGQ